MSTVAERCQTCFGRGFYLAPCVDCGARAVAPSCEQCGAPVTGTPVVDPTDRQKRVFCSTDCYDRYSESLHQ